jgi:hypothetical protein
MNRIKFIDFTIDGRDYLVSSDGEVYRKVTNGKKVLKKYKRNGGYEYVAIISNGKRKKFSVHRIVCQAFHSKPFDKFEVNHIDGNPSNNKAENLEWVSASENQLHSRYILGNQTGFKDKPIICLDTGEMFVSTRDAWRKTGISYCHISECASGKRKTAGGRRWGYATFR